MADELDIEAMLEAPYMDSNNGRLNGVIKDASSLDVNGRSRAKEERRTRSRSRSRHRTSRKRSSSRDRRRSRDRDHKRSKDQDRERKNRSRSKEERDRKRSKSRERRRRSRSKERSRRSRSRSRDYRRRSRERRPKSSSREERLLVDADQRTVLCMQLSQRVTRRDLEEFFGAVGKVREVRLIVDNKSRRHKGVAYIEFREPTSVPLALALHGQKLGGYPIQIQPTHAQKNRPNAINNTPANPPADPISHPPMPRRHFPNMPPALAMRAKLPVMTSLSRLYVGSLHFHITEEMLRSIFEPFGKVGKIELIREPETQRSKGYGFVTFEDTEDAKRAIEQLNGFELAGRPMKVNHANERNVDIAAAVSAASLETDYIDRHGIDLKASNRMHLMAKLAEGTGMQVPQMSTGVVFSSSGTSSFNTGGRVSAPNTSSAAVIGSTASTEAPASGGAHEHGSQNASLPSSDTANEEAANYSIATKCFLLSNMFDPNTEQGDDWPEEIRMEVIVESRKHGGAVHVYVDRCSQGNVYVKCESRHAAFSCVTALHGRWFSERLLTAAYIPEDAYHQLFADAATATEIL